MKHFPSNDRQLSGAELCESTQCMMQCRMCSPKNKTTFARFRDSRLKKGDALPLADMMNHIVFLLEGALSVRLKGTLHSLERGNMVFLSRLETPQITARETSLVVWLEFNNRVVFGGEDCLASLTTISKPPSPELACLDIRPAVERMLDILRMTMQHNQDSRCFHALKEYELFMYLWEEYSLEERIALFHTAVSPHDDLRAFMAYNYNPRFSGEDYAGLICVSRSTFNRLFGKEFGMPFYKWSVKHKEEDLRNALAQGTCDSKELAQRLGFKNVLSLYRFCRNRFGCSFQTLAANSAAHSRFVTQAEYK